MWLILMDLTKNFYYFIESGTHRHILLNQIVADGLPCIHDDGESMAGRYKFIVITACIRTAATITSIRPVVTAIRPVIAAIRPVVATCTVIPNHR